MSFSGPQNRPRRISCSSKWGPAAAKVRPSFDSWEGSWGLRSPLGELLRRCPCLHRLQACRPEWGRGDNVQCFLPLSRPPPNRVRTVGLLRCERASKVCVGGAPTSRPTSVKVRRASSRGGPRKSELWFNLQGPLRCLSLLMCWPVARLTGRQDDYSTAGRPRNFRTFRFRRVRRGAARASRNSCQGSRLTFESRLKCCSSGERAAEDGYFSNSGRPCLEIVCSICRSARERAGPKICETFQIAAALRFNDLHRSCPCEGGRQIGRLLKCLAALQFKSLRLLRSVR